MTKLSPTKYGETEERARSDKTPRGALNVPCKLLKMTATMKRRALKKRPSNLDSFLPRVSG
jgi:hypothetical protein